MALTKKKIKTPARKNSKRVAKKAARNTSKKTAKGLAKKKTVRAPVKKIKSPARKKVSSPVDKKTKNVVQAAVIPEPIPQNEDLHPISPENETRTERVEEIKKIEKQFENREQVVMQQENQKMKSAMANRQGMKRVFRTTRHR